MQSSSKFILPYALAIGFPKHSRTYEKRSELSPTGFRTLFFSNGRKLLRKMANFKVLSNMITGVQCSKVGFRSERILLIVRSLLQLASKSDPMMLCIVSFFLGILVKDGKYSIFFQNYPDFWQIVENLEFPKVLRDLS